MKPALCSLADSSGARRDGDTADYILGHCSERRKERRGWRAHEVDSEKFLTDKSPQTKQGEAMSEWTLIPRVEPIQPS